MRFLKTIETSEDIDCSQASQRFQRIASKDKQTIRRATVFLTKSFVCNMLRCMDNYKYLTGSCYGSIIHCFSIVKNKMHTILSKDTGIAS